MGTQSVGWKPKWRSHFSVCSHELFSMAHLFSGNQIVLQCWVKSETALSSHCLMQRSDRCQLLLTSCSVFCQLWSELAKTYFSDAVALFSDYLVHALNHTHTPNTWLSSYSLVLLLTRLLQMDPTSASVTRQKKNPPQKTLQHHHTCNGETIAHPEVDRKNLSSHGPVRHLCQVAVTSTFPVRIV